MDLLARRFKGGAFLSLLERIIGSYEFLPGQGLPIGSLTSQHFANLYLDAADRYLLSHPEVCAHVRYMDDMFWWSREKAHVLSVLREFANFLETTCRLQLKPKVRINHSRQGMTFCGFRILPGVLRLTKRKQRRYRALRQRYESAWEKRDITSRKPVTMRFWQPLYPPKAGVGGNGICNYTPLYTTMRSGDGHRR